MGRTVKIEWKDVAAIDGGGTRLVIRDSNGKDGPAHDKPYSVENLEQARREAIAYLEKLDLRGFDAVPRPPPPSA
jgi:hypothetical protein